MSSVKSLRLLNCNMEKIVYTNSTHVYYWEEVLDYLNSYHRTDLKIIDYKIECVDDRGSWSWYITVSFEPINRYLV